MATTQQTQPTQADSIVSLAFSELKASRWLEAGMATVDSCGRIAEVNEALADWLEKSPAELAGRRVDEVLQLRCPSWKRPLAELLRGKNAFSQIRLEMPPSGPHPAYYFNLELARHSSGRFLRLTSVLPPSSELDEISWDEYLRNEAARRETFFRLRRCEDQLQQMMQRWPGVVFSQRADCTFEYVSPAIEDWTGMPVEQWRCQSYLFWQAIHEADAEQVQQFLKQAATARGPATNSYRLRHIQTGRVSYILEHREPVFTSSGLLLGYEGVWLDVTRQTIAEKRLSSAAWKETLAILTMGMAHDFCNVMAGIASLAENVQSQLDSGHPFYEGLSLIRSNSTQGCSLIQRILNLHRGKAEGRNYHDLNELVREVAELVNKLVPRRITLEMPAGDSALAVYVDAFEFRQVLVNLVLNALDAMPNGGKVVFETSRHEAHPALNFVQGVLPRLPAVSLTVRDTGTGIPAAQLPLIFDPFFTTKAMNKGSGLGLYNARLFAEKHQGAISVESGPAGTAFQIWLAESDFKESEGRPAGTARRHTLLLLGAPGQALAGAAQFLRQNGYYVVTTTSEAEVHDYLRSPYYQFSAAIVQTTAQSPLLFADIRRQKLPLKTVLQVIACNQDELDTEFLNKTDLVIPADSSETDILDRLRRLLADVIPVL